MFKMILGMTLLIVSSSTAYACDAQPLLMEKSIEASRLAHEDGFEHGFIIYESKGICKVTNIFTSFNDSSVSVTLPWEDDSRMLYFIHTHPAVGEEGQILPEERKMSTDDKQIMKALVKQLGYEFTPGIVPDYARNVYFLYEFKFDHSFGDYRETKNTQLPR